MVGKKQNIDLILRCGIQTSNQVTYELYGPDPFDVHTKR